MVLEDGRAVGRLYEDRHSPPEYRWFWSVTAYVDPKLVMNTSGRAAIDFIERQPAGRSLVSVVIPFKVASPRSFCHENTYSNGAARERGRSLHI